MCEISRILREIYENGINIEDYKDEEVARFRKLCKDIKKKERVYKNLESASAKLVCSCANPPDELHLTDLPPEMIIKIFKHLDVLTLMKTTQ